jgi:intracellular sulfur oxidation DsrE/DsrF family protein
MTKIGEGKPRRRFLAQLGATGALLIGGTRLARGEVRRKNDDSPHDRWLDELQGTHRQFFHIINPGPTSLLPVSKFSPTYVEAYGIAASDVNAVVGLMGPAIALGMNDDLWARYPLGTIASFTDPATGQRATTNPLASGTDFSVTALQQAGVKFLVCNNTMRFMASTLARQLESTADAVYDDFRAGLLPGMIVVPGMVIAVNRAQERGMTYIRIA